jgi:hypothetical protein
LRLEVLEDRCLLSAPTLSYSTYLNSTGSFLNNNPYAVAVNGSGNAFVAGEAAGNGFVTELNATGTGVVYSTTLAGNGTTCLGGIALDGAGNAYVVGWTSATNLPTTSNAAFQASSAFPGGNTEAGYIAELNPAGSMVYASYLPGMNVGYFNSAGGAIAVDSSGMIYVTGSAGTGLPTTGNAFQGTYQGGTGNLNGEAFLAEINPNVGGSAGLLYASYLGGSHGDAATGIAMDASGNAYLTGSTSSTNFPTTSGAYQRAFGGTGWDSFVAKFNPALSGAASLVYSTYLGATSGTGSTGYWHAEPGILNLTESGPGIAVDSAGDAYVTGSTTAANFPTTPGALQTKYGGGTGITNRGDSYVTKLNPTGTGLVYSTFLGGNNTDGGAAIAVDGAGNAYVTGWTLSNNFRTQNPIQVNISVGKDFEGYQNSDVFVATLNSAGSALTFSTYLGSSGDDYGFGVGLDGSGNVYVAGYTGSTTFPVTPGAYQTSPGNGFVAKITAPAGPSNTLSVTGFPSTVTAGTAGAITVTARDPGGNVLTDYTGTVHFSSSDSTATLPANYTFTAGDAGVHTFSKVTLRKKGTQTLAVSDTLNGALTATDSISVT